MKRGVPHAFCQRRARQSGVALVELALVLPLLIVLAVMVTEFGRAFLYYNTLAKSLRDAVRYLAVLDPGVATTDPAKLTVARHMVVYGVPQPAEGARPQVPGLNLTHVPVDNIQWSWSATTPAIRTVSIRITGYRFQPLIAQAFGLRLADAEGQIPFGEIAAHMRAPE